MIGVICIIASCLIAEGTVATCDREPGSVVRIDRPLTYADVADLPARGVISVERRACSRIAADYPYPANWRLVWSEVERPHSKDARGRK